MGLLDDIREDPQARRRRHIIMVSAAAVLTVLFSYWLWFLFLHMPERRATEHFFDALSAGNTQLAYQIWKADPAHYSFEDFTADWGPTGQYGPVKSYQIESASTPPRGGSGINVVVEVSPDLPFPSSNDIEKSARTKEVRLWVEKRDKSIGFAPF